VFALLLFFQNIASPPLLFQVPHSPDRIPMEINRLRGDRDP
jgi:hypothetical protein